MLGQLLYIPQSEFDTPLFSDNSDATSDEIDKLAERLYDLPKPKNEASYPVSIQGSTSYVEQQPWIQNMTLRKNILFGKDFDAQKYVETIHACQLESDLNLMNAGDRTEIGERGITLSGGQKARLSLARAVYQDRDIILMDDPISALDADVRKRVFQQVF